MREVQVRKKKWRYAKVSNSEVPELCTSSTGYTWFLYDHKILSSSDANGEIQADKDFQ